MMKQIKFPAFSRDLKLTFNMNQQQTSESYDKHLKANQESVI